MLAGIGGCTDAADPGGVSARFVWSYADHAGSAAQPYADSDLVVFTTLQDSSVVALDAHSGSLRWETHLPRPAGLPFGCASGCMPAANITASGNVIVVPAWDVYGLDRSTGAVRWTFTRRDDYPGYGSIAAAEGRVYTVGRRLYALNAATGSLVWQVDLGEQPFRPVIAGGVLYVETRGALDSAQNDLDVLGNGHAIAVDASTGTVRWRYPVTDPDPANGGSIGPAFVTSDLVIVTGQNGHVYALDRTTGQPRWITTGFGPYPAGAVVVDGTVITAGNAGTIDGFSLSTGQVLWRTPNTVSTPTDQFKVVGKGSSVFDPITRGDGVALISAGWLVAVDARGTIRWHDGGAGFGGPVYSTPATYRDGIVYIGAIDEPGGAGFYAVRVPPT
jgi:outer membrane protein assembly factor BamB